VDPTVTTSAAPGDMTLAARLATNAAMSAQRAGGPIERQVAQTEALASLALSLAQIAGGAATLAEQQPARPVDELSASELYDAIAERQQPEAATVPDRPATLAELEAAPNGTRAMSRTQTGGPQFWVRAASADRPGIPWIGCGPMNGWASNVDLVNETAYLTTVPAPFVRTVDGLTDDELDPVVREANGFADGVAISEYGRSVVRRTYDLVAARLRVDGPRREPEPAEITAAALNAAAIGWRVTDNGPGEVEDWTKSTDLNWRNPAGVPYLAADLIDLFGPLSNLRPPEPEPAVVIRRSVVLDEAGQPETSWGTRQDLITAALHAAAEACGRDGTETALTSAWADVDAAAREHVAALDGPATAPRGLPELSEADVAHAEGLFRRERTDRLAVGANQTSARRDGLRAVLTWYRLRLAGGTASTGGYDPATLAPGSVVLAGGRLYVKSEYENSAPWLVSPLSTWGRRYAGNVNVPSDGVLVVDGATLGGGR
jgi:hypothetical protein